MTGLLEYNEELSTCGADLKLKRRKKWSITEVRRKTDQQGFWNINLDVRATSSEGEMRSTIPRPRGTTFVK